MQGLCSNMHFTKQGMINLPFWPLITRNPTHYIKFINWDWAVYMCLGDASFNHIFFQCLTGISNYASRWWSTYTLQASCSWIVDSHISFQENEPVEINWYPGQHSSQISTPLPLLHGNMNFIFFLEKHLPSCARIKCPVECARDRKLNEDCTWRPLNGHHLYLMFSILSIMLCDGYSWYNAPEG
jgi:hypothetical protein